ncbi:glycosyltransferase family 10 domain-containing protein [Pedobacter sp. UC225_61]|uniref:glycosyltransferase family 10 domain-containing protein n=1 Tax=Pedobacter sp. UC225_61 TaxID=3374623 RepID=UPI0037977833
MSKKSIKIKFQNGLSFNDFVKEVFEVNKITDEFDFEESDQPDFIVFGPYGNNIPPIGNYTRIGYFCENMTPDLTTCKYAFGIPLEKEINNPNYKRIQWHGVNPELFIKNFTDNDIDRIVSEKTSFCNFLYSNKVPYREEFFRQLSKYKKVDAPGKSMNNMGAIDSLYKGNTWERKRQFLSKYKFTIAFENYAYPGYQTEKLYDAMQVNSLPIYSGDINVNEIFNVKSFLNANEYIGIKNNKIIRSLEESSQQNFVDFRPQEFRKPQHHLSRKLKSYGRRLKMYLNYNNLNFEPLIEKIIEIDNNKDLYINYLKEPWLNNNQVPLNSYSKNTWLKIFNEGKS